MDFPSIKIKDFEGPFDLLLHLIKKNQMDIYNVEISKITNQYLKYIDEMKFMDLEITSEFIVVAATLIEIKSKHLLPKIKKDEEEDEEDQEKNLIEKLILYKKIKKAAEFFKDRYVNSGELYTKKPEIIEEINLTNNNEDIFKNLTLLELYNMYNNLLEIYNNKQNKANVIQKRIYVDKYKIEDKLKYLLGLIENNEVSKFSEIIDKCECKLECIVSFLALLEMVKLKKVRVYQSDSFDNILIERRQDDREE
ncbi:MULTISPECIES: segregation/condensation protein A [Clostridium]|uniref:Segregation and condensation protein A n=1 Tax=Clostridium botulinum (strain Alaska E43 / Type E3) TaxID=508767 RepID=SCPA_CLOBA|nr:MULTISPECIES: segregation/condensation protein A [Clostridium]B2V486.1 RecName: Full=Segregation and condensation protein A [Clostridium botulinum E3 str. Alaska E43]ACD51131.1 ScpA/B protein [Clostridium botulinum E3 str. Alaska E43]AJF30022.1 segregation and condensation protein A [Clostridium botulinum]AJF33085.1 segregation and condensation protein A [Clostridium botulinum]MBN1042466.1 segregation/condensation protein A [Clostridium botulinum]MBN1074629.1 segregation/condensation prote